MKSKQQWTDIMHFEYQVRKNQGSRVAQNFNPVSFWDSKFNYIDWNST